MPRPSGAQRSASPAAAPPPPAAATSSGFFAKAVALALAAAVVYAVVLADGGPLPASLAGSNVVITGASRGIGEQLALQYSSAGASVLLVARSADRLAAVAAACSGGGGVIGSLAVDLATPGAAERVMAAAEAELGGVDTLVLNHIASSAGGYDAEGWLASKDLTGLKQMLAVNTVSCELLAQRAVLPAPAGHRRPCALRCPHARRRSAHRHHSPSSSPQTSSSPPLRCRPWPPPPAAARWWWSPPSPARWACRRWPATPRASTRCTASSTPSGTTSPAPARLPFC